MKKIYQVNEKHFFVENGFDYLSAVSPFNKGIAYKDKETAIMVAQSILNDHKNMEDTLEVTDLIKLESNSNLAGTITKKYGFMKRIAVIVEEISLQ
jgi:hypothetical protein